MKHRSGEFYTHSWGRSTGKPRATISVRMTDGPDSGRLVNIEMKAAQLARYITSLSQTLQAMHDDASHKTAVMTEDGEIHGCALDGRPYCERPAKFLGPAFFTPERIKCAMCIDVLLNS